MPEHERFEELCALAAVGQISEGDLTDLHTHLQECRFCRQLQSEFVEIGALWLSSERHEESDLYDPRLALRSRVLRVLEGAGAEFSDSVRSEINNQTSGAPIPSGITFFGQQLTLAHAAVIILAAIIGFSAGSYHFRSPNQTVAGVQSTQPSQSVAAPASGVSAQSEQNTELVTANLRARLSTSEAARDSIQNELVKLQKNVADLEAARSHDAAEMAELRMAAEADRNNAQVARTQLRNLEEVQSSRNADLLAAQYQIRDLETKLSQQSLAAERERQMLLMASSSEMRDVIGSRDLHIIDVADVDNGGPKKPFGRVFYTEGKSLIFYAYDLTKKGSQTFYAWGQREGNPHTTHALGALLNDDQKQGRWVFKCNDSKVLSQIDSVYVTVETSDRPGDKPKGNKLLNAYLGMPANHP